VSGVADERLLSVDVRTEVVEADGASTVLATASATLGTTSAGVVGLWEAGPGTDTDVEIDEVFLVLAGSGTVTFDDGSSIALRPGVLVRLVAGDRTTWHVTERLRKLYLT
jgi:uncharacterized protein